VRYRLAGQIDSTDHFADAVDWAIGTFAGYDPTPSTVTLRFGCETYALQEWRRPGFALQTVANHIDTPEGQRFYVAIIEGLLDIAEKIYPELPPRKPALKPAVKRLAKRRAQKRRSS
jgi:hypothetical protein